MDLLTDDLFQVTGRSWGSVGLKPVSRLCLVPLYTPTTPACSELDRAGKELKLLIKVLYSEFSFLTSHWSAENHLLGTKSLGKVV